MKRLLMVLILVAVPFVGATVEDLCPPSPEYVTAPGNVWIREYQQAKVLARNPAFESTMNTAMCELQAVGVMPSLKRIQFEPGGGYTYPVMFLLTLYNPQTGANDIVLLTLYHYDMFKGDGKAFAVWLGSRVGATVKR